MYEKAKQALDEARKVIDRIEDEENRNIHVHHLNKIAAAVTVSEAMVPVVELENTKALVDGIRASREQNVAYLIDDCDLDTTSAENLKGFIYKIRTQKSILDLFTVTPEDEFVKQCESTARTVERDFLQPKEETTKPAETAANQ